MYSQSVNHILAAIHFAFLSYVLKIYQLMLIQDLIRPDYNLALPEITLS